MASAFDTHWRLVEQRLRDNWHHCPISWPGVAFDPDPHNEFLRTTPLIGDGFLTTMTDDGWNRVVGVWDLDLFERHGTGLGKLREWADELRDLFDRVTVGSVEFRAASGPQIINNDRGWSQLKVSIPFTVDEQS